MKVLWKVNGRDGVKVDNIVLTVIPILKQHQYRQTNSISIIIIKLVVHS